MKYFFIVGERSGDTHAASVIRKLVVRDSDADIVAWGGKQMEKAGAKIISSYSDFSFIGFWEVLSNLRQVKIKLRKCKADVIAYSPDVLILVDFPGFNLRIAKFAKKQGIKVCYFISPKIWAWKKSRIAKIKSTIDEMLVILPFEKDFYQNFDLKVNYVGNPTVEEIGGAQFDQDALKKLNSNGRNIAYLPGSRIQEVKPAINTILKLADICDDYHFLIAGVDNIDSAIYEPLKDSRNITLIFDKTYEALKSCDAAIVTSGTATLEAALLDVPQIVVYRISMPTYLLARLILKVPYISLVNLIGCRLIVKELIQGDYNPINISNELETILNNSAVKKRISEGYSEIRKILGNRSASDNAADAILKLGRS